ncbi:hydantoinase/oxoprolinase family protein [Ruminococcus sp. OA3]|uniref:hydantoinase/oxoprolinase family protein n=1 Tax=Ruminococcus sp. OA3 TaxID=2914164 RepID=UPI001F0571C3|nr:hydantoinase/oxoprolinase family protein [Ruminococcus sp. OA3]MCH1981912.1 hydantoinase/oxoprolinase family protein [Ruminococcus sp. OA3]
MKKILGIDTGGTYTDSVVLEAGTKNLRYKSKTLTTKHNLRQCIETCFEQIPSEFLQDISMVCLSTTLATNAIVENHGCKEGLILVGKRPKGMMPTDRYAIVEGLYDIMGRMRRPLNQEEIIRTIEKFRDKVDAIAISGYASIRNPAHEIYIAEMVRERLDIPVVCAHELTSTLGYYERTVTADLNARLIPLVCTLIDSVKHVMERLMIDAPLMIVKGDGSLMTDACARSKPIETILSGPAASVMGGVYLSGVQDAFVMDIGGTTTDIANVVQGQLAIRNEGAKVGRWYTHVRAAEVFTAGLGGDSRIFADGNKRIQIGPEKSIPYCMASEKYPELLCELGEIYVSDAYRYFRHHDEEAYVLIRKYRKLAYTKDEEIIIEILRSSPHTLYYLEHNIQVKNLRGLISELLREGVIGRISLTPTDVLHCSGAYRKWPSRISELATAIAADQMGMTLDKYIRVVHKTITQMLNCDAIQAAMYFDHQGFDIQNDPAADYFINYLYFEHKSAVLTASYQLEKPVVAIGASAAAWTKDLSGKMDTEVIIPEHAEVANAVGAAVGKSIEKIEILIRQDSVSGDYIVYSPVNRRCFKTLADAARYARRSGNECIERLAESRNYDVSVQEEDTEIEDVTNGSRTFVERVVTVRANFHNCG